MEHPIFISPAGKEYTCLGHAIDLRTSWEWYAFEAYPQDPGIYFGYVMGFDNEFGDFSEAELNENGIRLEKNPATLAEIAPPLGWRKK